MSNQSIDGHLDAVEISYQAIFLLIGGPLNLYQLTVIAREMYKQQKRQEHLGPQSWLLHLSLHMIIADLIILLVYCSGKTIWQLTYYWYGGEAFCRVFTFFSMFGYYLWANVAVATGCDMLYCICNPLKSRQQGVGRIRNWLIFCWVLAIAFSSPQLVLWGTVDVPLKFTNFQLKRQCIYLYRDLERFTQFYQLYHALTLFYIPILLIIVTYAAIAIVLSKKQRERVNRFRMTNLEALPGTQLRLLSAKDQPDSVQRATVIEGVDADSPDRRCSAVQFDPDFPPPRGSKPTDSGGRRSHFTFIRRASQRLISPFTRQSQALLKLSIAVILNYGLCWLPYQVVALHRVMCGAGHGDETMKCTENLIKLEWLEGIMISGACINPIIYRYRPAPSQPTQDSAADKRNRASRLR